MRLEFHTWHSIDRKRSGVLCVDTDTGVAVVVRSEGSPERNQKLAEERVRLILAEAVSPGGWTA